MPTRIKSICAAGTAAATLALLAFWAQPASAHVSVKTADKATQGGFATIAFQVPNEMSDANTTKLRVQFPSDHPLLYVNVKPVPGWTYTVTKTKLTKPESPYGEEITEAVSEITWEGGQVKPGEFEQFPVSIGPLPEGVDAVSFPAIQTYDNGEDVSWIEKPAAGGEEPEHPAPSLALVAKDAAAEGSATAATAGAAADGSSSASTDAAAPAASDSSNGLAVAGLVVALVALGLAGFAAVTATRAGRAGVKAD